MDRPFSFQIRICDIVVEFRLPDAIALPDDLEALRCGPTRPDDVYTVQLLTRPLRPNTIMVHSEGEAKIFQMKKGWLHIYPALGDGAGCQVACLFCPNGHHTIYYPASRWAEYSEVWHCAHLICGERLLLRHDALLLHSSVVMMHGKAVLFSGASGVGKSTQAGLWRQYLGADIINGDRAVIRPEGDGFLAAGSIWSGTSHIYRKEQIPIAAVFLIQWGDPATERLGYPAFIPLLSQTLVNSWDPDFMNKAVDLLSALIDRVPIYRLSCRPDRDTVALAYQTAFKKEDIPWL